MAKLRFVNPWEFNEAPWKSFLGKHPSQTSTSKWIFIKHPKEPSQIPEAYQGSARNWNFVKAMQRCFMKVHLGVLPKVPLVFYTTYITYILKWQLQDASRGSQNWEILI